MVRIVVLPQDGYEKAVFYVARPAIGAAVIISDSPSLGCMVRDDMTEDRLYKHIANLKNEGFDIRLDKV